jgi:ParB family transcriptional regulator, chromosome partitioning protein
VPARLPPGGAFTRQLPEPLRTADTEISDSSDRGTAQDVKALPVFLAEDQDENPEEEPDQPAAVAAE